MREPSVSFADVESLKPHSTIDSKESLIHLAFDRKSEDVDKFERTSDDNDMLKESINAQKKRNDTRFLENCITGFALKQMSSKSGTCKHSEKVFQVLSKEPMQLEDKGTLVSVDSTKLTRTKNQKSLNSLSLLKEKRDASLKGRACAGSSK